MTDYTKNTGTAGKLIIRDDGTRVSFIISCSDSATHVNDLSWSGTVNGSSVGGTVDLPAGFGSKTLGTWTVSSSQTVTFAIGASGTQGIGGPTSLSATINRSTVPSPPGAPVVTPLTATSARFTWAASSSNGGSPLTNYGLYVSTDNFATYVFQKWVGVVLTYDVSGLLPGTTYQARTRAQNANGASAYSPTTVFTMAGTVQVSDGVKWQPWVVDRSDGVKWIRQRVDVSDGAAWKPAG